MVALVESLGLSFFQISRSLICKDTIKLLFSLSNFPAILESVKGLGLANTGQENWRLDSRIRGDVAGASCRVSWTLYLCSAPWPQKPVEHGHGLGWVSWVTSFWGKLFLHTGAALGFSLVHTADKIFTTGLVFDREILETLTDRLWHQAWENIWKLHPVVNQAVQVKQKQK